MKTEFVIHPIGKDKKREDGKVVPFQPRGMQLVGQYQVGQKMRILLSESEYIEIPAKEKDQPKAFEYEFNTTQREVILSYDSEQETDYDKGMHKVCNVFWKEHPLLSFNGHSDGGVGKMPLFDIYSRKERTKESFTDFNLSLKIGNRVNEMSDDALRDVWYFYGKEPKGYSHEDLVIGLVHPTTGAAMLDGENFLKTFAGETNAERNMTVTLRKALMLGVITNRNESGRDNFYLKEEFLGTTFNDLLAHFKREERVYKEHVQRKVELLEEKAHGKAEIKPEDVGGKPKESAPEKKKVSLI